MRFRRTKRFQRAYKKLSQEDKDRADKALSFLAQDMQYPSLRVKKIQGTHDIFEVRASDAIRFTFQLEGDLIVLRVIGRHDEVLKKP